VKLSQDFGGLQPKMIARRRIPRPLSRVRFGARSAPELIRVGKFARANSYLSLPLIQRADFR
jgi:hypothetical protein